MTQQEPGNYAKEYAFTASKLSQVTKELYKSTFANEKQREEIKNREIKLNNKHIELERK